MKTYLKWFFVALVLVGIGSISFVTLQQKAANKSLIFATPSGTQILETPVGWSVQVVSDRPKYPYVIFISPKSAEIGVTIRTEENNATLKESVIQRFLDEGGDSEPSIVYENTVAINGASGYMVEGKIGWSNVVDGELDETPSRVRIYSLNANGKNYFIRASAHESDWNNELPQIEAAIQSLYVE